MGRRLQCKCWFGPVTLDDAFIGKTAVGPAVACIGDSITSGNIYTTRTYPQRLGDLWDAARVYNSGVSGNVATQIAARYTSDIGPWAGYTHVVILGGVNDMAAGTAGATAFATLEAVADHAIAAGKVVVWVTILPWSTYSGSSAPKQVETTAFNDLVRAKEGVTVLDLTASFSNGGLGASLLTAYDVGDGLHPNDTGAAALAAAVYGAIP